MLDYLKNPYPWRAHYKDGETFEGIRVPRESLLEHTYNLLFPDQPLTFNIDILDATLIESSLYHHYILSKQGVNFSLKIQGKYAERWKKLKQEVTMAIKNPNAIAKKPVSKPVKEKKESEGRGPSEHVKFMINRIIQQKLTDDEIKAAATKAFPGVKILGGNGSLSYFRCKLNNGNLKIAGEKYLGSKLIGIKKEKTEVVKTPVKTPAKTSAKIPAKV